VNALSRVVLALYSLLWIGACAGIGVLLWQDDQMLDLEARGLNLRAYFIANDADLERWLLSAILGLVALLGLLTLTLAFQRAGPSRGTLRMRQQDGGIVEVTAVAIESLLKNELEQLPEIRQASVKVRLAGGAVDSDITASIEPSASIANVTATVGQVTAQVLREQVGVGAVRRPVVHIRYDEIQARPVRVESRGQLPQRPATPAPPEAPTRPASDEPANE